MTLSSASPVNIPLISSKFHSIVIVVNFEIWTICHGTDQPTCKVKFRNERERFGFILKVFDFAFRLFLLAVAPEVNFVLGTEGNPIMAVFCVVIIAYV